MGSVYPLFYLGRNYKLGRGIEKYLNKSCFFFYRGFLESQNDYNKEKSKSEFLDLLKSNQILWKSEYHFYWPKNEILDSQIFVLLLISKNRSSSNILSKILVKFISLKIIQYLCHYNQKQN